MNAERGLDALQRLGVDPGPLPKLLADIEALNGKLVKAASKSAGGGDNSLEYLALSAQRQQLSERADELARDLLIEARENDQGISTLQEELKGIDIEILELLEQARALMAERDQLTQQLETRAQIFNDIEVWYGLPGRHYQVGLPWGGRGGHWPGAREALRAYLVRYCDLADCGAPGEDLIAWFTRRR